MPRLKNYLPSYRKHKQSGQAIVTLTGRDFLLGPYGTEASHRQYDRLIAEWLNRGRQPLLEADAGVTVAELSARYWTYSKAKYVRRGQATAEQFKIKTALRHLLRLYEDHPASEFAPRHLKVVRQAMIDAGWARKYINQQVGVLVRLFKWGVTEGLLPPAVHAALALIDGLRRGETAAREKPRIRPVDDATVSATLPFLSPTVRAMVELQRATGMRPGELCTLRPCDLDRTNDVWEYLPADHKTAHRDQDRRVCIGPRGQDILRPFLLRPADAYCFSPIESADWHRTLRHEARKTPLSCGHVPGSHRKRRPKRVPRERYDVASYRRAIHRACDKAFAPPADIADDLAALANWRSDHRWSPHRLRHSMGTQVRKEFSLEHSKAVLGHASLNTTGIYSELDHLRAVEVARRIG
ncbi:MAG: site-specific integrase [Pirellulales bacterium]